MGLWSDMVDFWLLTELNLDGLVEVLSSEARFDSVSWDFELLVDFVTGGDNVSHSPLSLPRVISMNAEVVALLGEPLQRRKTQRRVSFRCTCIMVGDGRKIKEFPRDMKR